MLYFEQGRLDEAAAEFVAALRLDPQHGVSRMNLGVTLVRAGQIDRGVTEMRRALVEDAEYVEGRVIYGVTLAQIGRLDEAVQELESAVAADQNNLFAREQLERVRGIRSQPVIEADKS
jgi:predicted Zn-dependent protease